MSRHRAGLRGLGISNTRCYRLKCCACCCGGLRGCVTSSYEQGAVVDLWLSAAHLFHPSAELQSLRGMTSQPPQPFIRKKGNHCLKKFLKKCMASFSRPSITFRLNEMYTLPSSTLTCQMHLKHLETQPF